MAVDTGPVHTITQTGWVSNPSEATHKQNTGMKAL